MTISDGVYYCVRVYADGSAKHTWRDAEGLESWLEYNRKFRFGNALFVDGVLREPTDRGYLSEERCALISSIIRKELETMERPKPWQQGPQVEVIGGVAHRRHGYPDDQERKRFPGPPIN